MLRKLEVAGTNLASDLSQLTAVWKVGPCLRSEVLIACAHPVQQNTVLMMPRMLSSPLSPRPLSPTTGQTHSRARAPEVAYQVPLPRGLHPVSRYI